MNGKDFEILVYNEYLEKVYRNIYQCPDLTFFPYALYYYVNVPDNYIFPQCQAVSFSSCNRKNNKRKTMMLMSNLHIILKNMVFIIFHFIL